MTSPATGAMRPRFDLTDALAGAGAPLLFGVRLWVSVCLALFVAFWLQLDNPSWAGATAAIMCQPQLGASLRKGWFRVIGTVIGAVMIVVLTAFFPQDRIAFLGLLALWGGVCAFAATVLKNFASYAAALAGYTAAIIAADTLGATGGASPSVFLLAVDARQRDLHRDRVRRRRSRRDRSRRRPPAARADLRRSGGRHRRSLCAHAGAGADAAAGHAGRAARVRPPRHRARSRDRRSARRIRASCATTRRSCRAPSTACSARWTAGARLRPISAACRRRSAGRRN